MTKQIGRKTDIIIKPLDRETEAGILDFDRIIAFADTGLTAAFRSTEGVMVCSNDPQVPNRYILLIDPRYDTKWVIEEVKATAMIAEPERKKVHESERPQLTSD